MLHRVDNEPAERRLRNELVEARDSSLLLLGVRLRPLLSADVMDMWRRLQTPSTSEAFLRRSRGTTTGGGVIDLLCHCWKIGD